MTSHPEPDPTSTRQPVVWTAERIRALGTVTDIPTTGAIFGLSRSVAYDLARTGGLPVPVLRFGTRYRVPVAAILTALHLPTEPDPAPVRDLTAAPEEASIVHTKSAGGRPQDTPPLHTTRGAHGG